MYCLKSKEELAGDTGPARCLYLILYFSDTISLEKNIKNCFSLSYKFACIDSKQTYNQELTYSFYFCFCSQLYSATNLKTKNIDIKFPR